MCIVLREREREKRGCYHQRESDGEIKDWDIELGRLLWDRQRK